MKLKRLYQRESNKIVNQKSYIQKLGKIKFWSRYLELETESSKLPSNASLFSISLTHIAIEEATTHSATIRRRTAADIFFSSLTFSMLVGWYLLVVLLISLVVCKGLYGIFDGFLTGVGSCKGSRESLVFLLISNLVTFVWALLVATFLQNLGLNSVLRRLRLLARKLKDDVYQRRSNHLRFLRTWSKNQFSEGSLMQKFTPWLLVPLWQFCVMLVQHLNGVSGLMINQ